MPSGKPKAGESLADLSPDVASQWHPMLNGELTPFDISPGSGKKVWWKCKVADDHEWMTEIYARKNNGCPACGNRQVSVTNSLASLYPEIAAEWHPTKNGELTPELIIAETPKKFWWKCDVADDHEWLSQTNSRIRGTGCPACAGRQVSVTNSLASLYPEIAAEWHPTKNGELTPAQVVAGSHKKVWWKCDVADDHEWKTSVGERTSGKNCPSCRGLQVSVTNSLASLYPEIAAEWHPTKNGELTPAQVVAGSNKKVWWKCDVADDHEWRSAPNTRKSRGCPACAGRQVSVTNSLASLYPEIAAEWHPTKNGELTPETITAGNDKKVWWKCDVADDHEWNAGVGGRTRGTGCPSCKGDQISVTNSLASLYPEIAAEWHPTKNGDLLPDNITARNPKKVWWKCHVADDHEWETTPGLRTREHGATSCPACSTPAKLLSVTNSLSTLFPEIATEWHPTKNGSLTPEDVIAGSHKKVWWQCSVTSEHEWESSLKSRTAVGSGCHYCVLTPRSAQEIRLAHELSALIKFDLNDHKVRLGNRVYDIDIIIEELKLVLEFDGSFWHRKKLESDINKTKKLELEGWTVIRVRERPLDPIHKNDVMVKTLAPVKEVADLVLQKIIEVTGVKIPKLKEYLASDEAWREKEALVAIREYQAENARKKAERDAKREKKSNG